MTSQLRTTAAVLAYAILLLTGARVHDNSAFFFLWFTGIAAMTVATWPGLEDDDDEGEER